MIKYFNSISPVSNYILDSTIYRLNTGMCYYYLGKYTETVSLWSNIDVETLYDEDYDDMYIESFEKTGDYQLATHMSNEFTRFNHFLNGQMSAREYCGDNESFDGIYYLWFYDEESVAFIKTIILRHIIVTGGHVL